MTSISYSRTWSTRPCSASAGILRWDHYKHELNNYKDTKTKKCRLYWCLEFIDWRYSQSCWYFLPSFVNYCPSSLLSGSPPPHLPLPKVKVQNIKTECGWEGVGWCWILLEIIFCRSLTLCFWPDSEPTKLLTTPAKSLYRSNLLNYGTWHYFLSV
jgi:hypothetical protein